MPDQQLDDEILAEFSAGNLPEMKAILVATHLTLCPASRKAVEHFDAIGGSLLASSNGSDLGEGVKDRVLASLEENYGEEPSPTHDEETCELIPAPLRSKLGSSLGDLKWKKLGGKIKYIDIAQPGKNSAARLMNLPAGINMPTHTHEGTEMTVVLSGGFSDAFGRYSRGDVAVRGIHDVHKPKVDAGEDCLCFVVTDAPLRMKGLLGFFLNRLKLW